MYFTSRLRKTKTAEELLYGGTNPHFPAREWILVLQSNGSQGQQTIRLGPAIERIANHRQSGSQQMEPDLVGPARQGLRLYQRPPRLCRKHSEFGRSFLTGLAINLMFPVLGWMGAQWLATNPMPLLRCPFHHRQIALRDSAIRKNLRVRPHATGTLHPQQYPGGWQIQSMNEPEKLQVSALRPKPTPGNAFPNTQLQLLDVRRIVSRLHNPTRWLVDRQHGSILIKDRNHFPTRQFQIISLGHDVRSTSLQRAAADAGGSA